MRTTFPSSAAMGSGAAAAGDASRGFQPEFRVRRRQVGSGITQTVTVFTLVPLIRDSPLLLFTLFKWNISLYFPGMCCSLGKSIFFNEVKLHDVLSPVAVTSWKTGRKCRRKAPRRKSSHVRCALSCEQCR